jgi:hypothetical protein
MSSSTTKKFREFMAEPIGDKGIRDVPGIGDVLGAKLSEAGYEKVRFFQGNIRINHVCFYLGIYFVR